MGLSPFEGPGIMFSIIPIIIIIGFILVFTFIIVFAILGVRQWSKNNASPVLTVDATVVTKRSEVNHYHNNTNTDNMFQDTSSTTYYVTFEVASGDRMEFHVRDKEYGLLVEQDNGKLTFQGTRYLGFLRSRD
ncbi:MAG: DUF2500 domain-containing protein [Mobilitalea sp.]